MLRELTRAEVEALFTKIDSKHAKQARNKKVQEGHLVKDTRAEILRETAAKKGTKKSAAGVLSQEEKDVLKAEVKKSAVKAAAIATKGFVKEAVAAAMQAGSSADNTSEESESEEEDRKPAAAAVRDSSSEHSFAASTEWKEMKEWRKKKDKEDTSRDSQLSAMRGEVASFREESRTCFSRIEALMEKQIAAGGSTGNRKERPFNPETARCSKCKELGHGKNTCQVPEADAKAMKDKFYGIKDTAASAVPTPQAVNHTPQSVNLIDLMTTLTMLSQLTILGKSAGINTHDNEGQGERLANSQAQPDTDRAQIPQDKRNFPPHQGKGPAAADTVNATGLWPNSQVKPQCSLSYSSTALNHVYSNAGRNLNTDPCELSCRPRSPLAPTPAQSDRKEHSSKDTKTRQQQPTQQGTDSNVAGISPAGEGNTSEEAEHEEGDSKPARSAGTGCSMIPKVGTSGGGGKIPLSAG